MVENASRSFDEDVIYLNNAGQAWLDPAVQALGQSIISKAPFDMHGEADQTRIRELYATLIENKASNIAIMPSTAFATTFVARNTQRLYHLELAAGATKSKSKKDKILVLEDQFCSAVYPWQELCDESSATKMSLKIVPYPKENQGWTEAVLEHLTDDVLATCLPPLHWSDGALLDLKTIGLACHEKQVMYIVDGTQAIGAMPCTVKGCGNPIVMMCSVHKWLRGPHGASLVYVDPSLNATWQPLDQHGRSRDMADGAAWDAPKDEMGPKGYPEKYFKDARKFDGGGKPNPILLPMLRLGMEQVVKRVILATAQRQLQKIMKPVLNWALSNGFKLSPGPHCYHIVGIQPTFLTIEQMLEVNTKLQSEHKVYIAVRCGGFRISPYLNTTTEEISRFVEILSSLCQPYR